NLHQDRGRGRGLLQSSLRPRPLGFVIFNLQLTSARSYVARVEWRCHRMHLGPSLISLVASWFLPRLCAAARQDFVGFCCVGPNEKRGFRSAMTLMSKAFGA